MTDDSSQTDRPYVDFPATDDGWTVRPKALPPMPKRSEMLPAVPQRGAKVASVLGCVCDAYDVSMERLLTKDRHRLIAEARCVAFWLLRVINGLSYPEIGRAVGDRHHTTAMSGVKRVLSRREREPEFMAFTDSLMAAVVARIGQLELAST